MARQVFNSAAHPRFRGVLPDPKREREQLLQLVVREAQNSVRGEWRSAGSETSELARRIVQFEQDALKQVHELEARLLRQIGEPALDQANIATSKHRWEAMFEEIVEQERRNSKAIQVVLRGIRRDESSGELDVNSADMLAALEEQVLALEEQVDESATNIQLGMAVAAVSHEFQNAVIGTRNALRRLKSWADRNAVLRPVYDDLRTHFEHLDGYLTEAWS